MICILHGYLLEGSGSNLWTRSIIRSLCQQGQTVHLLCQENHPEIYDFITAVYHYYPDGIIETKLQRAVPYPGMCIMHKPFLGETLPVYVWDKYDEFADVQPMIQLPDEKIEKYLDANIRVLRQIVNEQHVKILHANHAVLMSVVAQRVAQEYSLPYAIMPHGSAIEYAVKKDKRFFDYALEACSAADLIFVIGKEIRQRVHKLFPQIEHLDSKMIDLNLGVDISLFRPVDRQERTEQINELCISLTDTERGKKPEQSSALCEVLFNTISKPELLGLIKTNSKYNGKLTDFNVERRLTGLDWQQAQVILFVGRLIAGKGIHSIIATLPYIFEKFPKACLIIVGHGPLREPLEALLWAFENGSRSLVENIVDWGTELEGSGNQPLVEVRHYFDRLQVAGTLEKYFNKAQRYIRKDRVIFTGYLTHRELRYLFPACDVAIFPSVVAEAGPLVFLEALASGCFPIGTYFAGMAASIDSIAGAVPDRILEIMKLSPEAENTVSELVEKVTSAFSIGNTYKTVLHELAVEKYDWQKISLRLSNELFALIK
ncbi:MAG: glycosyltransferase [Candidatus Marinimicrobia bacterium]|nr:glycosyltransferase [Candidatus Neomarinimicrobiota bacterium]